MQWNLSDEQAAYQTALRDWLGDVAPADVVRSWLDAGDPATFTGLFTGAGWSGVGIPEESGGQGGGMVELALTAEALGRHAAPSAAWLATVIAAPALVTRPAVLAEVLGGAGAALLVSAESIISKAGVSGAGAPVVDAEGRISGAVARVLAAGEVSRLVVPVTGPVPGSGSGSGDDSGSGDGPGPVALRLVDRAEPGVRLKPRDLLDRSRSVADVVLDAVPSEPLDNDGAAVLADAAVRAAVLLAADSLGATERMLELAVEYSKQRRQFGVPIGSFQAVKHAAATILVGVEAARSVVYLAAASAHGGDPQAPMHAAAAKAQVTAQGARAADSALTIHGAIGYTWEHDLHLFYQRAKLDERLFGSPTAWNEVLADHLALI